MDRGIIRRLDSTGRPTIPVEFRKLLDLKVGDEVEIKLVEDSIVIKKRQKMYTDDNYIILNDVKYHKDYVARLIKKDEKGDN